MIWQSKRVLKSQKLWKKPNNIKNRPKGVSIEDWNAEVAEWKLNKLIVLDKVPKTRKQSKTSKDEE
jgi:hypothetical protein